MAIEVITNYQSNSILLKNGNFCFEIPLDEINAVIHEIEFMRDVMNKPLAELLLNKQLPPG